MENWAQKGQVTCSGSHGKSGKAGNGIQASQILDLWPKNWIILPLQSTCVFLFEVVSLLDRAEAH